MLEHNSTYNAHADYISVEMPWFFSDTRSHSLLLRFYMVTARMFFERTQP